MALKSVRVSEDTIKKINKARALILIEKPQTKASLDNILKLVLKEFIQNWGGKNGKKRRLTK